MLDDAKIQSLIKTVSQTNIPKWRSDYFKRVSTNLKVHTKGLLFSKVASLFPNENLESQKYCINTYEPITKGSIAKAVNNIGRIFGNSSFNVECSTEVMDLIAENRFDNKNLFSFFLDGWVENVISTDPNCACAVYPSDYDSDPIVFIRSELVQYDDEGVFCFISEVESEVEYVEKSTALSREIFYDSEIGGMNGRTVVTKTFNTEIVLKIKKPVFHLFIEGSFIRFYEEDETIKYEEFPYQSKADAIPAFFLTSTNLMEKVQDSFLSPFIPFGNLALLQHRNHRAVDLMFSYPRMSEVQTACDAPLCNDGVVRNFEGIETNCIKCHGTGWLTVQSPFKVYKKNISTGLADPEITKAILAAPPVEFYTPDVNILNYSKDSWRSYLSLAEEAVFVQQKVITGHVESAKAKEIGNEQEYTWILNINKAFNADLSRVIQIYENTIHANPVSVAIEQPTSFAIVPESDAFVALDLILKSSAPVFLKSQKVESFVKKFVSKSSIINKALKILKAVDPLVFYTQEEVQMFKANNIVTAEAWGIHVFAYPTLMQLYALDNTLFDKDEKTVIEQVKAAIPQPAPIDLKSALLKGTNGN